MKFLISKLNDVDEEQHETQHWIEVASDCQYVNGKQATELINQLSEIGRMINGMIEKAEQFCKQQPRITDDT